MIAAKEIADLVPLHPPLKSGAARLLPPDVSLDQVLAESSSTRFYDGRSLVSTKLATTTAASIPGRSATELSGTLRKISQAWPAARSRIEPTARDCCGFSSALASKAHEPKDLAIGA